MQSTVKHDIFVVFLVRASRSLTGFAKNLIVFKIPVHMEYAAQNIHFVLSNFRDFHVVANFAEIRPSQC